MVKYGIFHRFTILMTRTCSFLTFVPASLLLSAMALALAEPLPTDKKSPQDPVPGLIARIYGPAAASNPKKTPTHLLAIFVKGDEFLKGGVKTLAEDELRGVTKSEELMFVASGYIVLDADTEVAFDMADNNCKVGDKDYGRKSYTHLLKKGKYPIEIHKCWGHGVNSYSITEKSTGKSVLFHTGEALSKELNHSVKVGSKTLKSKLIGEGEPKA